MAPMPVGRCGSSTVTVGDEMWCLGGCVTTRAADGNVSSVSGIDEVAIFSPSRPPRGTSERGRGDAAAERVTATPRPCRGSRRRCGCVGAGCGDAAAAEHRSGGRHGRVAAAERRSGRRGAADPTTQVAKRVAPRVGPRGLPRAQLLRDVSHAVRRRDSHWRPPRRPQQPHLVDSGLGRRRPDVVARHADVVELRTRGTDVASVPHAELLPGSRPRGRRRSSAVVAAAAATRVVAAASPRLAPTDYPRRRRGVAATHLN